MEYFFIAIGVFSLSGAIFNWDWYMNSRRARLLVKLITRTGARVFYAALGLFLIGLGALGLLGMIDLSS